MIRRSNARSNSFVLLAILASLGAIPSACASANQKPKQVDSPTGLEGDSSGDSQIGTPTGTSADNTPDVQTPLGALLNGNNAASGGGDTKLFDSIASAPAAKADPKGAAATDANAKKIREVAKQFAPGMKADGPMFRATLKENERVQADITLNTGTCYAIVGYGDKVKDFDLHMMLAPGVMTAQDTTDDQAPVIGRAPDPFCPQSQLTYKLDMFAEKGAGDVAAQLYSRPR